MEIRKPFSYAHVTLISGDQGSGKSNTGAARIADASISNIHGLGKIENGKLVKKLDALPLSSDEKRRLRERGYILTYDAIKIIPANGKQVICGVPKGYIIMPSINIFANFHLYGIQYVYLESFARILELLDHEILADGRLSIDEYHMGGNARDSMTILGKSLAKDSFTYRKRHLDVDIMCAHERLADWTTHLVVTERITCSNEQSKPYKIHLTVKGKGQPRKEIDYDGRKYWKYYFTDELFRPPREQIERAIAAAR